MSSDKTGAPLTIAAENGKFTIAVDGKTVGRADYADRGDQRVFYHTVVDPEFGGRGLASILVKEALNRSRDEGKRIVPMCSMVETVLEKHPEYRDITDPVTTEAKRWTRQQIRAFPPAPERGGR